MFVLTCLVCAHGLYCKVHRGPERVQVLEVNVSLIDIEVGTSAYLVLVVTRVEDSIGPKCLGTWVIDVTQHCNVGLGDDVTY